MGQIAQPAQFHGQVHAELAALERLLLSGGQRRQGLPVELLPTNALGVGLPGRGGRGRQVIAVPAGLTQHAGQIEGTAAGCGRPALGGHRRHGAVAELTGTAAEAAAETAKATAEAAEASRLSDPADAQTTADSASAEAARLSDPASETELAAKAADAGKAPEADVWHPRRLPAWHRHAIRNKEKAGVGRGDAVALRQGRHLGDQLLLRPVGPNLFEQIADLRRAHSCSTNSFSAPVLSGKVNS